MIGVFDSGFGGLNVLKYFLRDLPDYQYIYLGDNARAPYGAKSKEVIYGYTEEAVDFLFSKGCKLIILACNTASAQALRKIQQEYLPDNYPDRRVLGVVRPVVEEAVRNNPKKIGVLGTRATVESNVYQTEINKLNKDIAVYQKSAPLLVPLIEEGWAGKPETKKILENYLEDLKKEKVDDLILGCTHYLSLSREAEEIMGENCRIYNLEEIVSASLFDYLTRHPELVAKKTGDQENIFYTTDNVERFCKIGSQILGRKIKNLKKISL